VLYGDVTGNWQPVAPPPAPGRVAPGAGVISDQTDPEALAWKKNQAFHAQLGDADTANRLALLQQMTGGELRPDIYLELVPTTVQVIDGVKRQTYLVEMHQGDGLQALDLELGFAPGQVQVVDVRLGDAASDFNLLSNDGLRGMHKIALYGVLPLQGTGTLLELTVEFRLSAGAGAPFTALALANERRISVKIRGGKTELESVRPNVIE